MRARSATLVALAVGSSGIVLASLSAVAFAQLTSAATTTDASGLMFSASYGEAANDLLDEAWPTKDRHLLLEAKAASERELALAPARGAGWLRLAIIDSGLTGQLDGGAQVALARSYAVAPLNERLLGSRVWLSYTHWSELTPDLRRQTLRHVETAWSHRESQPVLVSTLNSLQNPGGRLALRAKLLSLQRKERAQVQRQRELVKPAVQE